MERLVPQPENPFSLLGLPTTASSREIRRRVEELLVKVGLGLAPDGLTEERLRWARQALEDPGQRLSYELLWFLSPPSIAPPTVDPGDPNQVDVPLNFLQKRAEAGVEPDASLARHDLAVLRWAAFLANSNRISDLKTALDDWTAALASEPLWTELGRRVEGRDDPRLTVEFERLRAEASGLVLRAVASTVTRTPLSDRHLKEIVGVIRASGFPPRLVEDTVRDVTQALRTEVLTAISELREKLDTLPQATLPRAAVDDALATLRDRTRPRIERLRSVDPAATDPSILDTYGRQLSQLAFATAYQAEDWPCGISLMKEALLTARSQSVVAELAVPQARLRRDFHVARANEAGDNLDWVGVAAHSELAAHYADDIQRGELLAGAQAARRRAGAIAVQQVDARKGQIERDLALGCRPRPKPWTVPVSPPVPPQRKRGAGFWWSAGIVGAGGLLVILVIANSGGEGATPSIGGPTSTVRSAVSRPTPSPRLTTTPRRTPTPRPSPTPTCRERVQALKDDLERERRDIDEFEREIDVLEADLERLSIQIDEIEAQYPFGDAPPGVVSQYEFLVREYNRQIPRHNRLVAEAKEKVADYNRKVDEHNDLIERC